MSWKTLEEILEMDEDELLEYIEEKCVDMQIEFDIELLQISGISGMLDFIADNIHPEFLSELHSECQIFPGCPMFSNAETDEDIEEEMEHIASRD